MGPINAMIKSGTLIVDSANLILVDLEGFDIVQFRSKEVDAIPCFIPGNNVPHNAITAHTLRKMRYLQLLEPSLNLDMKQKMYFSNNF